MITHLPQSPNPNWKPGDRIQSPVDRMVSLDVSTLDQTSRYKLLIGAVVPRPIAFVSTRSPDGKGNLAPFSFFNGVGSEPLSIVFSCARGASGLDKDTLVNIRETGEFVVNSVNEWLVEAANATSATYPYGVDEMEKVGLTPVPSLHVKPARVKESAVHMECKLIQLVEIGNGGPGSATLVVGEVIAMHVHEAAYQNGRILLEEIKPISRLAGFSYGKMTEVFDIPRPIIPEREDR